MKTRLLNNKIATSRKPATKVGSTIVGMNNKLRIPCLDCANYLSDVPESFQLSADTGFRRVFCAKLKFFFAVDHSGFVMTRTDDSQGQMVALTVDADCEHFDLKDDEL